MAGPLADLVFVFGERGQVEPGAVVGAVGGGETGVVDLHPHRTGLVEPVGARHAQGQAGQAQLGGLGPVQDLHLGRVHGTGRSGGLFGLAVLGVRLGLRGAFGLRLGAVLIGRVCLGALGLGVLGLGALALRALGLDVLGFLALFGAGLGRGPALTVGALVLLIPGGGLLRQW